MNLEKDFSYTDIPLKSYDGDIKATFIASTHNTTKRKAVLYIHGVVDYFFHPHVAEQFLNHEFDFYALDLRRHGRSLMPNQKANFCKSVDEYFEEISFALEYIHNKSNGSVYLYGLSTGGLISTSYLLRGKLNSIIKGLILNSPFFDFAYSPFVKMNLLTVVNAIHKVNPNIHIQIPWTIGFFKQIHKSYNGEWDFDLRMKPMKGFPTYLAWLKAINYAQQQIEHSKTKIKIPTLILHSTESNTGLFTNAKKLATTDTILNVNDMKRIGVKIGTQVTFVEVKNGMHDIFLSEENARNFAFEKMFHWLKIIEEQD